MSNNLRYQGKPLLRLLECYVLWAIDELSESDAKTLDEMTPKLQSIYSRSGSWQDIISSVMELPTDIVPAIKEVWRKNSETAHSQGKVLSPQQFVEMFVDQNFMQ